MIWVGFGIGFGGHREKLELVLGLWREREREREREVLEAFGVTERKKSWLWVKKKRRPLGGGK